MTRSFLRMAACLMLTFTACVAARAGAAEPSPGAALTRLLAGLLFEVEPLDPTTFAATSLALLTVATVAAYIPARRSMRMAPVDALRTD